VKIPFETKHTCRPMLALCSVSMERITGHQVADHKPQASHFK